VNSIFLPVETSCLSLKWLKYRKDANFIIEALSSHLCMLGLPQLLKCYNFGNLFQGAVPTEITVWSFEVRLFHFLLHPFWNHWLFLQSDWLSAVRFIPKSHYFCSKSHLFLSQWEWDSKTKQPIRCQDFFKTNQTHCRKMKGKKAVVWQIWQLLLF